MFAGPLGVTDEMCSATEMGGGEREVSAGDGIRQSGGGRDRAPMVDYYYYYYYYSIPFTECE